MKLLKIYRYFYIIRNYKKLVNLIFEVMIKFLNEEYEVILVEGLKDSKTGELLDGVVEDSIIKIAKYSNQVKTLVHELIHIIFDLGCFENYGEEEKFVLKFEEIMYRLLSKKQKSILASYIKESKIKF